MGKKAKNGVGIQELVFICAFLLMAVVFFLGDPANAGSSEWQVVVGGEQSSGQAETMSVTDDAAFKPEPLSTTERMSAKQVLDQVPASRCEWYRSKLGELVPYYNTVASEEGIPPRLLAAVILNELADVGMEDVIQDQQMASIKGDYSEYESAVLRVSLWWKSIAVQSFGIAQISPRTAIEYDAVHVPPSMKERMVRDNELELYVAYRLLDRRTAIKAAARIIKGILKKIEQRQEASSWVEQFIRPMTRFSADNPLDALYPEASREGVTAFVRSEREKKLAQLVSSIYNSGNILYASKRKVPDAGADTSEFFPNALLHGQNCASMADDLSGEDNCNLGFGSPQEERPDSDGNDREIITWINLFGENDKSGRVHAGTRAQFKAPKRYVDERFAGMRTTALTKKPIFQDRTFDSIDAAREFLCKEIKNKRMQHIPGWGAYPIGDVAGGTYYINGLGCTVP